MQHQARNVFISPEQISTLLCHLIQEEKVKEKKQNGVCDENLHRKDWVARFTAAWETVGKAGEFESHPLIGKW